MDKILAGLKRFRRDVYPQLKPLYDRLVSTGQKPHALVIGCSDSRVAFETLTGCGPGELFIIRNAGNIIPEYGKFIGGVTASIEFAVTQLPVRDVIVCGHTHCGAMSGLIRPESLRNMPAVRDWVNFSSQARDRVKKSETRTIDRHLRAAIAENVKLAIDNLKTFPCVQERLAANDLRLHGWVYEIENGDVVAHDPASDRWISLTEEDPRARDVSGRFKPV